MENESSLSEMKKEIEDSYGTNCSYYCSDISSKEAVSMLVRKVGKVDILIHVPYFSSSERAQYQQQQQHLHQATQKKPGSVAFSSNAAASSTTAMNHRNLIQGFLPGMVERSSGHIVTLAGANGLFGNTTSVFLAQPQGKKKNENDDDSNYENEASDVLVGSIGADWRDSANQFALIGIAESLFFELRRNPNLKKMNLKSTLVCSGDVVGRYSSAPDVGEKMTVLAQRTIETICRGEEKVITPWNLWFVQILKLLPATWMERLIDSCQLLQVFGKNDEVKK